MDKETLSNYGWIVICVLVLAVMVALATPFGSYVASAVENTTQGLFDVQQGALSTAGIDIADQSFEGGSSASTPSPEELIAQGIVPEGGIYIAGLTYNNTASPESVWTGGTAYTTGQKMPATVTSNDLFIYGDYAYMYNRDNSFNNGNGCPFQYNGNGYTITGFYSENTSLNGWQVGLIEADKTEYGKILSNINNKPVTSVINTFYNSDKLTTAPAIPSSVTDMFYTFFNSVKLTTAPTIPSSVTDMKYTFEGCTALTGKISIPCILESENYTYSNCPATIEYYHLEGCGH